MSVNTSTNNKITREQALAICNAFRSLGLSPALTGTRLLNKIVQVVIVRDLEILILEDIYRELSNYFPTIKPSQMRKHIIYALNHRNFDKSVNNFKLVFGFEYDEIYFEPKNFIEELSNIIKLKSM